jgi:hypothetical protein
MKNSFLTKWQREIADSEINMTNDNLLSEVLFLSREVGYQEACSASNVHHRLEWKLDFLVKKLNDRLNSRGWFN